MQGRKTMALVREIALYTTVFLMLCFIGVSWSRPTPDGSSEDQTDSTSEDDNTSDENFITYVIVGAVLFFIIASLIVAIYYAVCKDKGMKNKHDSWIDAGVEIYGVLPSRSTSSFKRSNSQATDLSRQSDAALTSRRTGRFTSYPTKGPQEENVYADVVETIQRLKAQSYANEYARKPYRHGRQHRSASRSTSFSSHSRGWHSEPDRDTRRRMHSLDLASPKRPGTAPLKRRHHSVPQAYLNDIDEDIREGTMLQDGTMLKSALKSQHIQRKSYENYEYDIGYDGSDMNTPNSGYFSDGYLDDGYTTDGTHALASYNSYGYPNSGFIGDEYNDGTGYHFNDGFNGAYLDDEYIGDLAYPAGENQFHVETALPPSSMRNKVLAMDDQDDESPYHEIGRHVGSGQIPDYPEYDLHGITEIHPPNHNNRASFHRARALEMPTYPRVEIQDGRTVDSGLTRSDC